VLRPVPLRAGRNGRLGSPRSLGAVNRLSMGLTRPGLNKVSSMSSAFLWIFRASKKRPGLLEVLCTRRKRFCVV